jgi:hypothetical protein
MQLGKRSEINGARFKGYERREIVNVFTSLYRRTQMRTCQNILNGVDEL